MGTGRTQPLQAQAGGTGQQGHRGALPRKDEEPEAFCIKRTVKRMQVKPSRI